MTKISERWQKVAVADNMSVTNSIKNEYFRFYKKYPSRTQLSNWRRGVREPKYQTGVILDRVLLFYNY